MIKEKATQSLHIRVTETKQKEIKEASAKAGLKISEYVLLAVDEKIEREEK